MWANPVASNLFLERNGLLDDVYAAMNNSDTSEIVLTFMDILKKTNPTPETRTIKSEEVSTKIRNDGNQAFKSEQYKHALSLYNKALLYAPKGSLSLKLAYSNRSALLLKVKAFEACLVDIDTIFLMGCPIDIKEKLEQRADKVRPMVLFDKFRTACIPQFAKDYFKFNVKLNPDIPCASSDVEVIMESQIPKIVAANDIKVGTVLAVETAFVSQAEKGNMYISCYYCHKFYLNLIPCDGCCFALFCSNDCKRLCMEEFHSVECLFLCLHPHLSDMFSKNFNPLSVKAVLKMVLVRKSWKDIIDASKRVGVDRIKSSTINEIYNCNNEISMLCFNDEKKHFIHGSMYNVAISCAFTILYLEKLSFFPKNHEREAAIRAVARLLMYLSLYPPNTLLLPVTMLAECDKSMYHEMPNYGWFSFIGKLKTACKPNVITACLNNKMALVTLQPIKRGTELTYSLMSHFLDKPHYKDRKFDTFMLHGTICDCYLCAGLWEMNRDFELTETQKKIFDKINFERLMGNMNTFEINDIFIKMCKALAFFSDIPYSRQYEEIYKAFRRCIMYFQDVATKNVTVDFVL